MDVSNPVFRCQLTFTSDWSSLFVFSHLVWYLCMPTAGLLLRVLCHLVPVSPPSLCCLILKTSVCLCNNRCGTCMLAGGLVILSLPVWVVYDCFIVIFSDIDMPGTSTVTTTLRILFFRHIGCIYSYSGRVHSAHVYHDSAPGSVLSRRMIYFSHLYGSGVDTPVWLWGWPSLIKIGGRQFSQCSWNWLGRMRKGTNHLISLCCGLEHNVAPMDMSRVH